MATQRGSVVHVTIIGKMTADHRMVRSLRVLEWLMNGRFLMTKSPTANLNLQDPPPTPKPVVCPPEKIQICDIIRSPVFKSCHDTIPPEAFYEACVYDVCHMTNKSIGCSSLEAYAHMCTDHGVQCIDWRPSTNGQCEYKCPVTKVYKACGPAIQPTCNSKYNEKYVQSCEGALKEQNVLCNAFSEGCFCPEGKILFNTFSDTCVSACGCTGPDGNNKQPGDSWRSNCMDCDCSADTMSVICRPVECPAQEVVSCIQTGEVLVSETVDCCQRNKCVCDVSSCPKSTPCPLGSELVVNISNKSCCPMYSCVPKPVCVYNNTEYKPGEVWSPPSDRCVTYVCTSKGNQYIAVGTKVQCPQLHPENCIPGTEKTDANGCCTTCTPSFCALQKNTTFLQINDCKSVKPVELSACGGSCGTYSMYSAMKNSLMHSCSCCQEMSTSERKVEMVCSKGKKTTQTYIYIEQCGCRRKVEDMLNPHKGNRLARESVSLSLGEEVVSGDLDSLNRQICSQARAMGYSMTDLTFDAEGVAMFGCGFWLEGADYAMEEEEGPRLPYSPAWPPEAAQRSSAWMADLVGALPIVGGGGLRPSFSF
ncbi:hypothetical protein UPYG_G00272430 [Umbra pygmaea]|uniref:Uncharacterized protein n=1 Tax=Umbra pygmaea TaxID=75934 RepID=A0ABD0WFT3_UMBPY